MSRSSTWSSLGRLGAVRRCAIVVRSEGMCSWCLAPLSRDATTIDHVVPRKSGGGDSADNLVACCLDCQVDRPEDPKAITRVEAQLRAPLDLWAGRLLAGVWYGEWFDKRERKKSEAMRAVRLDRAIEMFTTGRRATPF